MEVYRYGQWYRITFYRPGEVGINVFLKDESELFNLGLRKKFKIMGYTDFYLTAGFNGCWSFYPDNDDEYLTAFGKL